MTRPAGPVRRVSKCCGSGRVGSGGVRHVTGRVGSSQQVLKSRWSVRVGSRGFPISRVGSCRVKRFSNLVGRFTSGHEVFKMSRVRSGHDPRDTGHSRVGSPSPASCFPLTDPRIWPADLARGSVFLQTNTRLPEEDRDPRIRIYIIQYSPLLA